MPTQTIHKRSAERDTYLELVMRHPLKTIRNDHEWRAALKVTGMERNIDTRPREAAPVRISLLDKGGHAVVSQVARPPGGAIQPGEARPFTISFFDPPIQAATAQGEFAFDAMKPAPKPRPKKPAPPAGPPAPLPSAELKLRGAVAAPVPAPPPPVQAKEAAPLPASSPYALPNAVNAKHG